jgi:glutaredoxin
MLKDYLAQNGFSFVEKLVDQDEAAQNEMISISGGFLGVPYTVIERDNGTKDTVVGFDKGRLNSILQIGT